MKTAYLIAPSLLSADITRLGDEVTEVIEAGADMVHLDVMDNHYVPNLTFGPIVCERLKKRFPQLVIDVHLMVSPVDDLIKQFAHAGANRIAIHPDATIHLNRSLQLIADNNCEVGLVLNPSTSPECLRWCYHQLDFLLIMTVNPGFGGQKLIPEVLQKIQFIHESYPYLPIAVDGGVDEGNIAMLSQVGASQFIAGSSIFKKQDYKATIAAMRRALDS